MAKKLIIFSYLLLIILLTVYSYALVDPNLTLFNSKIWTNFRNYMVNIGYYQRDLSSTIYIFLIIVLFIFYGYFVSNYKKVKLFMLLIPVFLLAVFSYPFLSHDFFNYMFDAKIFTFYHQNPYLHKALDFPADPWLRFMHWTHRTYPYGPTFLLITLIPSFLSFGKFILSFLLFKLMNFIFYFIGVYLLDRMNKKWAIIYALNPLIIIEGLVNGHNDLISMSLAIIGIYYLFKKNDKLGLLGRLGLLVSGGIKYVTLPLIILTKTNKILNTLGLLGVIFLVSYLSLKMEIQPWYFLALFAFLPFYEKFISNLNIFFAGLLFAYYPFIKFGEWNQNTVTMKHNIIIVFLIINVLIYLARFFFKNKKIFILRF